jgi:hypothetical protein
LLALPARAADEHAGHHPPDAAAAGAEAAKPPCEEKMAATDDMKPKAAGEDKAAMQEHMKAMRDKMAKMKHGKADAGGSGAAPDMMAQHRAVEKRLDMLEATLQLLVQRLADTPDK